MVTTAQIDYGALGKQRFDNFCHTIGRLISEKDNTIDLLVAGGNSGAVLMAFTELIYEAKRLSIPPKLSVPLYHYLPGHRDDPAYRLDTSSLQEMVNKQISSIPAVHNALFVDDEIYRGFTALGTLGLINKALVQCNRPKLSKYIIVAEGQGFKVPKDYPEVRFVPYDQELEGYSNAIFFFTPSEFEDPIAMALGEDTVFPFHCSTNVLLGVPVKEFNDGQPRFTDKFIKVVQERIPDFSEMQKRYKTFLTGEIKRCLSQ